MRKVIKILKSIYEFYRYGFPVSIILTTMALGLIGLPFSIYYVEKHDTQYRNERAIALEGCIKCKFTDYDNYYFYTCEGKEYYINRSTWINLNISECK